MIIEQPTGNFFFLQGAKNKGDLFDWIPNVVTAFHTLSSARQFVIDSGLLNDYAIIRIFEEHMVIGDTDRVGELT